jgi:hypothetical protein
MKNVASLCNHKLLGLSSFISAGFICLYNQLLFDHFQFRVLVLIKFNLLFGLF